MGGAPLLGTVALLALVCGSSGVQMTREHIDQAAVRGTAIALICEADLEGEKIYQAKWYKDGKEFYHHHPSVQPPQKVHPVKGTTVNESESDESRVVLQDVDLDTAGKYGCEITAEGTFATVVARGVVRVVEVPRKRLRTSVSHINKDAGDIIRVNCTSALSRPAANLTWLINDEKTSNNSIRRYPVVTDDDGLQTVTQGLAFLLREKHFQHSQVTLTCTAKLYNVHYVSTKVLVHRPSLAQRSSQAVLDQPGSGCQATPAGLPFNLIASWVSILALKTRPST